MTTSFLAYQLQGMEAPQEIAPMADTYPLTFVPDMGRIDPALRALRYADAEQMRQPGGSDGGTWSMDYTLNGYGQLFGRWPEGVDPAPLVPVRDEAAA